jgi:hypothetical protein
MANFLFLSEINSGDSILFFQPEVHGSGGVGHAILNLLSTPGAAETLVVAHHPNEGGKILSTIVLQSIEIDNKIYVVSGDEQSSRRHMGYCPMRTAISVIRVASEKVHPYLPPITVERVGTSDRDASAIVGAVLSLRRKQTKVERFSISPPSVAPHDTAIGIARESYGYAYRWCGGGDKPDSAGSHSVIGSGVFESMHPLFVSAKLAERFYRVTGSLYRVTNLVSK